MTKKEVGFSVVSEVEDKDGNTTETTKKYIVIRPNLEIQREAQKVYNRAFSDAIQSGALLRAKLQDFMESQGLWDNEKQEKLKSLQNDIMNDERKLAKGGFALSEARNLSIELRKKRIQIAELVSTRSSLDGNTAEGQADNQRFNYLVSACLVYNDSRKPVYGTMDEYLLESSSDVAIQGAEALAKMLYDLSDDFESKLPENQFLKKFNFVNDDFKLVNEDGKLVDTDGRLINEEGNFVDENGDTVDRDGNKVDEDGNYVFEDTQPFLDKDGKPIN